MSKGNKVYGLILPKKQGQVKSQSSEVSNVFGDDSDEDAGPAGPVAPYKVATSTSKMKRQTQMDIDKALQEDPNIYEYDEVYDQMQASKPQVGLKEKDKAKVDRKPKYIAGLLKAADQKKKDDERRLERKVQKEREAEGEMYADKEKFVTSAYKQKMLEMQEEEEREKREAAFEAMTDVTKQKDMSGFYCYLYRQSGRADETGEPSESSGQGENRTEDTKARVHQDVDVKQEPISPPPHHRVKKEQSSRSPSASSRSSSASPEPNASKAQDKVAFSKSVRATAASNIRRKRQDSSSSSASEPETQQRRSQSPPPSQLRSNRSSQSGSSSPDRKGSAPPPKLGRSRKSRSRSPVAPVGRREDKLRRERSPGPARRNLSPEPSRRYRQDRRQSSRSPGRKERDEKRRRSRSPIGARDREKKSLSSHGHRDRRRSPQRERNSEKRRRISKSRSPREERDKRRRKSPSPGGMAGRGTSRSPSPVRKEKRGAMRGPQRDSVDRSPETKSVNGRPAPASSGGVSDNLKTLRKVASSDSPAVKNGSSGDKPKPVDPAKKVYPHHNSAEDIAEARKRYLQRKIARERGAMG